MRSTTGPDILCYCWSARNRQLVRICFSLVVVLSYPERCMPLPGTKEECTQRVQEKLVEGVGFVEAVEYA